MKNHVIVGLAAVCAALVLGAQAHEQTLEAAGFGPVRLTCANPGGWTFALACAEEDGAHVLSVTLDSPVEAKPPVFTVKFDRGGARADHVWSPYDDRYMLYPVAWSGEGRYSSQLAYRAPLLTAFDDDNGNVLALACSEAFRKLQYGVAVGESDCRLYCTFRFFTQYEPAMRHYEAKIRLDARPRFWADAVRDSADWIARVNTFEPCPVPEAAFDPLYSTWYAFWQDVHAPILEKEMPIAHDLGMRTAILDDGWQKEKSVSYYSATGDWMPVASRFPDMKAHVDAVHRAGMKYMLWLSVPYVGDEAKAWTRFQGKFLYTHGGAHPGMIGVLDPRFPEVRQYLIETYERAVRDWGFDGLKLDFIDQFVIHGVDPAEKDGFRGRDIRSLPVAVDRLMRDVVKRLSAINPQILLEFRQQYMGPAIRQYGNMIRATDCPADSDKIRKLIADLRLTSGATAVHSDMLVWSPDETPERAARPILNSLFSTIQYSMVLAKIPPAHKEVIRNWLAFTQRHRATLLKGTFRPYHPELLYPRLDAESDAERIVALYSVPTPVTVAGDKPTILVNATFAKKIPVELARAAHADLFDVFGRRAGSQDLKAGLQYLAVPVSGSAEIR